MSCGCGGNKQQQAPKKSKCASPPEESDPCKNDECPCDDEEANIDCCSFERPPCGLSNSGCNSKPTLQQEYQQKENAQNSRPSSAGKQNPSCQCGGGSMSKDQPPAPRRQSSAAPGSKCQGAPCKPQEPCELTTEPNPTIDSICQQYGGNGTNAEPSMPTERPPSQSGCKACKNKKSASKEKQSQQSGGCGACNTKSENGGNGGKQPQQSGGCGCDGKPASKEKQPQQSGGCGCDGKPASKEKQPQQSGGCECSKNRTCGESQNKGKCSGPPEIPSCGIKSNNRPKKPPVDPAQMKQVIAPCCFGISSSMAQVNDDDEGVGCPCGTRTKLSHPEVEEAPECTSCAFFDSAPEREPEPKCK